MYEHGTLTLLNEALSLEVNAVCSTLFRRIGFIAFLTFRQSSHKRSNKQTNKQLISESVNYANHVTANLKKSALFSQASVFDLTIITKKAVFLFFSS